MDKRVSTEVDEFANRLKPLFDGKPVVIQLFNPASRGKKKDPLVVLTPGASYGWSKNRILVSVLGHGACVVVLETTRERNKRVKQGIEYKPRLTELILAGVPAQMARLLMETLETLNEFNKERSNGTSTTTRSRKRPRPPLGSRGTKPRTYTQFREAG